MQRVIHIDGEVLASQLYSYRYPVAMWLPRLFVLCKSTTSSRPSQSAISEAENAMFEGENAIFQVGNAFSLV